MLPDQFKNLIIEKLKTVSSTKGNALIIGIELFLKNVEKNTDEDYIDAVNTLKESIDRSPTSTRELLGKTCYDFFKTLEVTEKKLMATKP